MQWRGRAEHEKNVEKSGKGDEMKKKKRDKGAKGKE
jgi:hypothetical protein